MVDRKSITPEIKVDGSENQVQQLREANRQKEKSNRTLQRQISKLQIQLQESQVKPINKTTWKQLLTCFSGAVIAGFGLSVGALGAFVWFKLIGTIIWG